MHLYEKKQGSTVLINDWDDENFAPSNLFFTPTIPVNLFSIDENPVFEKHPRFRKVYALNETHVSHKGYPATSFNIFVSSIGLVEQILKRGRNSIWWNHKAFFLFINTSLNNSCQVAYEIPSTVWSFKILSAVYVCHDLHSRIMPYTFNPYAKLAPQFWNVVQADHVLRKTCALFEHAVEPSDEISVTYGEYIRMRKKPIYR